MRVVLVRQGNKYSEQYVKLLKSQINHEVLVLGDQDDADIQLSHNLKGWWSKIELFSQEMEEYRPFLYIDLDSYVLGPLPEFDSEKFLMCREWWTGSFCKAQSSMMWIPKHIDIFKYFKPEHIHTKGGDQAWLQDYCEGYIQDIYPNLIGSYKLQKDCPTTTVVTFHGRPKPPDTEGWAKDIWMKHSL